MEKRNLFPQFVAMTASHSQLELKFFASFSRFSDGFFLLSPHPLFFVLLLLQRYMEQWISPLQSFEDKVTRAVKEIDQPSVKPPANCKQCDKKGVCTTCHDGFFLDNVKSCHHQWVSQFPPHDFLSIDCSSLYSIVLVVSVCSLTLLGCGNCSSSTVCSSCNAPFFLQEGRCVRVCGSGYTQDVKTRSCHPTVYVWPITHFFSLKATFKSCTNFNRYNSQCFRLSQRVHSTWPYDLWSTWPMELCALWLQ